MGIIPVYFSELTTLTRQKVPYLVRHAKNVCYPVPHRHNYIEFSYVTDGTGEESINNLKHELRPGTFSLVLPYQIHTLQSSPSSPIASYTAAVALDTFLLTGEFWSGFTDLLLRLEEGLPAHCRFVGQEAVRMNRIWEEMLAAFDDKGIHKQLLFKTKLLEALLVFDAKRSTCRDWNCNREMRTTVSAAGRKNVFWSTVHYIHTHSSEQLSLQELADRFHTRPSYISAAFQKHLGTRYTDFLNEVRIQNTCALLSSTELAIIDIAFEAGFESYSAFSRVFKKIKGVTAQQYRKHTASIGSSAF